MKLRIPMVHRRTDVHAVVDAVPLVISRLRALTIDSQGVVDPASGERRSGLRVTSGVHGRRGCRYRLVIKAPPAATADALLAERAGTTSEIELTSSDPRSLGVTVRVDDPSNTEINLNVRNIERQGIIEVHAVSQVVGGWPIAGKLVVDGTADLAAVRRGDGRSSPVASIKVSAPAMPCDRGALDRSGRGCALAVGDRHRLHRARPDPPGRGARGRDVRQEDPAGDHQGRG